MSDQDEKILALVKSEAVANWIWEEYERLTQLFADDKVTDGMEQAEFNELCFALSALTGLVPYPKES